LGSSFDFPVQRDVYVTPQGTTQTTMGTFPGPGTYTVWVASYQGYWRELTAPTSVVVV
jgi:hypothetical protein